MASKFSPAQRAYIRKRSKHIELDPSEQAGELNIIPFLDIVVNLMMVLLVMTVTVVATVQIHTMLPGLGRKSRKSASPDERLNLSLTVTPNGVIVAGSGGKLAPGCTEIQSGRVMTVPKTGADFDWEALTTCAAKIKEKFPDEQQVIVGADPTIEFKHVVQAMDAMRYRGEEPLFPDILLSGGLR